MSRVCSRCSFCLVYCPADKLLVDSALGAVAHAPRAAAERAAAATHRLSVPVGAWTSSPTLPRSTPGARTLADEIDDVSAKLMKWHLTHASAGAAVAATPVVTTARPHVGDDVARTLMFPTRFELPPPTPSEHRNRLRRSVLPQ